MIVIIITKKCKTFKDKEQATKTWVFGDDMSPLSKCKWTKTIDII